MHWSRHPIPPMRLESRFGDRVVPAFAARPTSIWAMVAEAAATDPGGDALVCGDRRMTWGEVADASARVAGGLRGLGLIRGDRVAVLLGNRIEFVLSVFAAARLGLVTVLLSPRQQTPEIAYVLNDCGSKLLIHEAGLADRLPEARDVPALTHRIAVDDDVALSRFATLADGVPWAGSSEVGEEDTAMILYTWGRRGGRRARCLRIATSSIRQWSMRPACS